MKKYVSSATKWLAICSVISIATLLTGVISIVADFSDIGLQLGLTMLGGPMSILFLGCFFAEKSRYFTITADELVLPRGAILNGKIVFKKTVVKIEEISSVESNLYHGDGLIAKDTYFHTLKLKDGTAITFPLYAYGKEAEKEILETIKNRV